MNNNNNKWLIGGIAVVVLACLCLGVACVAVGGLAAFNFSRNTSQLTPGAVITQMETPVQVPQQGGETPVPDVPREDTTAQPSATPLAVQTAQPAGEEAQQTLKTLEQMVVPINDPRELAHRLEGKNDIPATLPAPKEPLKVGAKQTFWASNTDNNDNFKVQATLRYVSDHLYFWVEDSVQYNSGALNRLADTFEKKIYPTDRAFFGSEWSPGIDDDVHLYVLFASGLGNSIAGYFSSADELPPQVHQYSNAHEMFMMNSDGVRLEDEYIYSVMAHEFQHMIHWYRDRNEESWMNEGFSEVAAVLNGYDLGGADAAYTADPDMQLTFWPSSQDTDTTPHYGASFLFLSYFLDRFGEKTTQELVANPDNGMDSIDKVLAKLNVTDAQTGKTIGADDVFADWVVTSFLNDSKVGDGRYAYKTYKNAPQPSQTEDISDCSADWQDRTVHQYGVDYINIDCKGDYTLKFQGSTEVGVLPVKPSSGSYAFWSNKGDESDMSLTREFDFTQASGPLTFKYKMWYDLEKDYDYLYLEASTDGGANWQIIKTPSGRDKSADPSGNAYGWGYNGRTGDWKDESVDLSQFAGKKVQLRFEYITDAAVNGEGFLLDDVSIPEINYSDDFEKGDGGWQGNGFVRIQNRIPQNYRLELILNGRTVSVQNITLDANSAASIPLKLSGDTRGAVLVVSGVTRFTTQEASYRFSFQK